MTDHYPDDGLDALDFSASAEHHDAGDALDFTPDGTADDSSTNDFSDFDDYPPAPTEPEDSDLDALAAADEEPAQHDELDEFTSTVTNPSETVSVSALPDGSIRYVELSAKSVDMTEAQLTDEILTLAHLAQQAGLAGQRNFLLDNEFLQSGLRELGLDGAATVNDLSDGMGLPTAAQADAERAEVFAARYPTGHD